MAKNRSGTVGRSIVCAFLIQQTVLVSALVTTHAASGRFQAGRSQGRLVEVETTVFEVRGTSRIGVSLTVWPSLDGRGAFQELFCQTADLGKTWQRVDPSALSYDPMQIGSHSAEAATTYRIGGEPGKILFMERSTDGGKTWRKVKGRIKGTSENLKNYSFLGFHPRDPATLYVSGSVPGTLKRGDSSVSGLYVSHDRGASFSLLLASTDPLVLSISESKPDTIYAVVSRRYIARSDDSGGVWRFISPCQGDLRICDKVGSRDSGLSKKEISPEHWVHGLETDPRDDRTVYALTDSGIWKTSDGGEKWCLLELSPGEDIRVSSMVLAATQAEVALFAGTDRGLFVSYNRGRDWSWLDLEALAK